MKTKYFFSALFISLSLQAFSQTYPAFGNEIPVTINGLTFDAMEPSISADGNFLFFNSLNDGITTSLYYASRVNDSVFNYVGPLTGANETNTPRLDAVASSDSANNFFWVSLRNFPNQFDNCFHGTFNGSDVVNIGRVHGTFYIYQQGWLIMDAAINYDESKLYYCNAYFGPTYSGCSGIPCEAKLGVAQKQNDSTFNKLSNSDGIMQNVNDTNYIVYAPFVTKDGLELFFTRALHNATQTEICVSVRTSPADTFSLPQVIYASTLIPEAPTLTTDKLKMYYHKKSGNVEKIFLRYRTSATTINEFNASSPLCLFPNPTDGIIYTNLPAQNNCSMEIFSLPGKVVLKTSGKNSIDISDLPTGIYFIRITEGENCETEKIIKQ